MRLEDIRGWESEIDDCAKNLGDCSLNMMGRKPSSEIKALNNVGGILAAMDLVQALLSPSAYPEPTGRVDLIQTHISWVSLTEGRAWKVKKPVKLEFLDFSVLRRLHHYLKPELVLNRRLCPDIYLAVQPVYRQGAGVRIGGRGRPLEYILEMVRLPQDKMMDEVADRGELTGEVMDRLVARLVPFYREADTGAHINRFGEPGVISYNHEENFARLKPLVGELLTPGLFREIQDYARSFLIVKGDLFRPRIREGRTKNAHNNPALGNFERKILFLLVAREFLIPARESVRNTSKK